ncbi:hypothetical protein [Caballeronia fortuita]|uniref:hypothetical protein n=1 Tax=Caballeronia fortuita TaxID=1777138 RepID=UPI0012FE3520|nr:hypothetical protein [Caballeronia fortuita]
MSIHTEEAPDMGACLRIAPVILARGSGTHLWPKLREQLVKLLACIMPVHKRIGGTVVSSSVAHVRFDALAHPDGVMHATYNPALKDLQTDGRFIRLCPYQFCRVPSGRRWNMSAAARLAKA